MKIIDEYTFNDEKKELMRQSTRVVTDDDVTDEGSHDNNDKN